MDVGELRGRKLAIIGAETMARNYALQARELGVESHVFAWEKGAVARKAADVFHPISIFETDRIVETCRAVGVEGVVATTELTVAVAATVADRLGLVGVRPEIAVRLTDKYLNREAAKGVPNLCQPRYALVHSPEELIASGLSFPLVLKPVAEGGKRGVTVVRNEAESEAAVEYAADESKRGYEIIAEEFVADGTECSVESLSYRGEHRVIQVTEKISSGPPHCVELGHIQPARISAGERRLVETAVPALLTALGYDNGPCHTEVKLVGGKLYLIEVNTRPGGDFITWPLVSLSTGYDLLKGAIGIAFDRFEFPSDGDFRPCPAGVCFVTEQTRALEPLFRVCRDRPWCHWKNDVGPVSELRHNNSFGTNCFIWKSETGLPSEIREALS